MKRARSNQKSSPRTARKKSSAVASVRRVKAEPKLKVKAKPKPSSKQPKRESVIVAPKKQVAVAGTAKSRTQQRTDHRHKEAIVMAPGKQLRLQRPPRTRAAESPEAELSAHDLLGQQAAPEKGRYRLQVDRQTKASYPTQKAAQEAGLAIKRAYLILHVAIFDADEGMSTTIALPAS